MEKMKLVCLLAFYLSFWTTGCSNAQSKYPKTVEGHKKNMIKEYKLGRESFRKHLLKVQKGWTKEQLLHHAGVPDDEDNAVWLYKWNEGLGGLFHMFLFTFEMGCIVDIKEMGGCEATQ